MAVEDRVAFACMFLSNSRLYDYLTHLTEMLSQEGDLAGILLTGKRKKLYKSEVCTL